VLGAEAPAIEAAIDWRTERRVVNPAPEGGLSSSLRVGFGAVPAATDRVLVALGDQPRVSTATIRALLDTQPTPERPIIVPQYADDPGRNPVLVGRPAFDLVTATSGDRGLGPLLAAHPELVQEVPMEGANLDIDTRADLAATIEAAWAERVRANREQVDAIREVPDGSDFYAPVNSLFRADPTRTDDPLLDTLLDL